MPETRFLPKKELRSTGLPRTTSAAPPPTTAGSNASSPVSAAPGVTRSTHQHVVNARNPSGAVGGAPARGRAQDAKVQIVDRRPGAPSAGGGGPAFTSSVQLMDRIPTAAERAAERAAATQPAMPPVTGSPFSLEQALLIAGLTEQYRDGALKAGDSNAARTAQEVLDVLMRLHRPQARAAQLSAVGARSPAGAPSAPTAPSMPAQADLAAIQAAAPGAVVAQTRVEIIDRRSPEIPPAPTPSHAEADLGEDTGELPHPGTV